MTLDLDYFKKKLEEEKIRLENQLGQVGKRNPSIPGDWEPTAAEMNTQVSEQSELADAFEEMEKRSVVEVHLEDRLNEVITALERIKTGTYGKCDFCEEQIDEKRLEVNPAALTCVKHSRT